MDNIAIVGMGCLFPDYTDKEKFWNTLIQGGRFIYHQKFLGKIVERSGLPHSGAGFFAGRFPDAELKELDAFGDLFKWVAYVTDEALKESGYAGDTARLRRTGMIAGSIAQTIREQLDVMHPFLSAIVTKEVNAIIGGNRFRYRFRPQIEGLKIESLLADTEPVRYIAKKRGFGGPVITFNSACASPLYAIKLASIYLNAGEADMIIAGAHCSNESTAGICGLFDIFGVLCGVNESTPLDMNSKGLITGSGAGMFALKRLADAEHDGDKILAVIENVGWSNDGGSGAGIMSPSVKGQLEAYESAYSGGLSRQIDYIECHATGTVVGDRTEIESISRFFDAQPSPLIGALKGSTGHFFTATACASIAKVVMALKHGVIPATIGVSDPMCDGIVLENTEWKALGAPRRAGVNAFGFGGINAHLVLREHIAETRHAASQTAEPAKGAELALIGMGLNIGSFHCVEDFLKGLINSKTGFTIPDGSRFRDLHTDKAFMDAIGLDGLPKGAYLNNVEFDTMRFKMPIKGDPFFLRRDMLMLETAAEALDDAGIREGSAPRTAVFVHSAPDYTDQLFMASIEIQDSITECLAESYPDLSEAQRKEVMRILKEDENMRENADNVPGMITNIRGNRLSAHWGFTGPSFTVFEQELSVFRCIELARYFISEGIADQAVIGLSSLSGEIEHIYTQKELGQMGLMSDRGVAEGAVALVLKKMELAVADGDRIYATVSGAAVSGVSMDIQANAGAIIEKTLKQAGVGKGEIRAAEIPRSYDPEYRTAVENACLGRFAPYLDRDVFKPSDIEAYLGFGFSLSAAASIVRHALQLYLSRVFVFNESSSGGKHSHFCLPREKTASLVTGYTKEGQFGCIALSACGRRAALKQKLESRHVMLPIPFYTPEDLTQKLQTMESAMAMEGFKRFYERVWATYRGNDGYTAVLLCHSKESARSEIEFLRKNIQALSVPGAVIESVRGSFCTMPPFGQALGETHLEWFGPDVRSEESTDAIAALFGLPPEVSACAGLGEAIAFYQPKNYLLRLGAKLLSHRINFNPDKYLDAFNFYILNRPSFIIKVPTGMSGVMERLGSEGNRKRISGLSKFESAIIGMGFHAGEFGSVESFLNGLMTSKKAFQTEQDNTGRYLSDTYPLIEKTVSEALYDSGLPETVLNEMAMILLTHPSPGGKAYTEGGAAGRAAAQFGMGGPSYTVYEGGHSLYRGLALAENLIKESRAAAVCVCAAPPADVLGTGGQSEGAAVLILKEKSKALTEHNKIYACISAVETAPRGSEEEALSRVLDISDVRQKELRAVDVSGSGSQEFGNKLYQICHEQFAGRLDNDACFTETQKWFGRKPGLIAAASLVKNALQLFFFYVFTFESEPASGPGWFEQKDSSLWCKSGEKRAALIAGGPDEYGTTVGFAVLTECIDSMQEDRKCASNAALLPLGCDSPGMLREKLEALVTGLSLTDTGLDAVWADAWRVYRDAETPAYTAALLFDSRTALREEASYLLEKTRDLSENGRFIPGGRYESKRGSYFTADPYGADAKVVYMNPPGGMQHLLLFYNMLMYFPRFRHEYVHYINSGFLSEMDRLDYRFGRFAIEMNMIGIADSIASQRFGLSPDILTGASLGEIAVLFSYNTVEYDLTRDQGGLVLQLLKTLSSVFNYNPNKMRSMFLRSSLKEIRSLVEKEQDTYMLIDASPKSAMISGNPEAVERILSQGSFVSFPMSSSLSIHTPIVEHFYEPVYEAALECNNKLRRDLDFEVYSAALKKPLRNTVEALAEYTAAILTKHCDFYGLLEILYEKGARVFIDMGTGGVCQAWANLTFEDRDTLCFSVYPPIIDTWGSHFRVFAKLLANHINFNADAFIDSFDYAFMYKAETDIGTKAVPEEAPAISAAPAGAEKGHKPSHTVVAPAAVQSAIAGYKRTFLSVSLQNSLRAYFMYLENEALLLGKLRPVRRRVLWDYEDILEITGGSPSKVWGERYAVLDTYKKRARLPLPPFMFVTRIMAIDAEFGKLRPSHIDFEIDINSDCIMSLTKNTISYIFLTESSHVAIFLLAYIGIDIIYGKEISYRILNTTAVIHGSVPVVGDTVNARLEFVEFMKSGTTSLVKSKYTCYKKDELVMTMELLGGFFTQSDRKDAKGILPEKKPARALRPKPSLVRMKPRAQLVTDLNAFYNGQYGSWIYSDRSSAQGDRPFINPKIRMLSRIISFEFSGGDYGLGLVIAETDIDENHWAFKVHFKNDPVFPGSLLVEAANHIQLLFAMNAGYLHSEGKYCLSCKLGLPIDSLFRGEIAPAASTLRIVQHIKEITETGRCVMIIADSDVYCQGKHIARTNDISLAVEEITG